MTLYIPDTHNVWHKVTSKYTKCRKNTRAANFISKEIQLHPPHKAKMCEECKKEK